MFLSHQAPTPYSSLLIPLHLPTKQPEEAPRKDPIDVPEEPAPEPTDPATAKAIREAHRREGTKVSRAEGHVCSAPICPLDPHWAQRDMRNGEAACAWLLEMAKEGPESHYVPEKLRKEVAQVLPSIIPSLGLAPLRVTMKQAAKTGSRRANARRLRKATASGSSLPLLRI